MAMVGVDGSSHAVFGGLTAQVDWLGLGLAATRRPALSLHSSNEPGELPK